MTEEEKKAALCALHILTRCDRTEKDLRERLGKKEFSPGAVQYALSYVRGYGYLDDARYARSYIKQNREKKGKKRITIELSRKGVDQETLETVWEELDAFDEQAAVRSLLRKKWKSEEKPDQKELRRLYGYLARLGFDGSVIWKALAEENLT